MTVPVLPDSERRTRYVLSSPSTGPLNVGFDLYADSSDYSAWIEIWDDGVKLTAVTDYTLTSPSGAIASLARPITDARITFVTSRSGNIDIVGAQRPRRPTQLTEGTGEPAASRNRTYTELKAMLREAWDKFGRVLQLPPGDTATVMPAAATRANKALTFDSGGAPTVTDIATQVELDAEVATLEASIAAEVATLNGTITNQINRTVRGAAGSLLAELPSAGARANLIMGFDASGNPTVVAGVIPDDVVVSVFMEPALAAATGAAFFGTVTPHFPGPQPWADVMAHGADPTGVADSSTAFSDAVAELGAGGGTLYIPRGTYKLTSGLTISNHIRVVGAGALNTTLTAGGTNVCVVDLNASRSSLEHITVLGFDSLTATQPAVRMNTSSTEAILDDCYINFGNPPLSIVGSDNIVRNVFASYGYGTSIVNVTGLGTYFHRCKFDQGPPTGTMPTAASQAVLATAIPARDNLTSYSQNQVVTLSGYVLQKTNSGSHTTAGSAPSLTGVTYASTITDGTVEWKLLSATGYISVLLAGAGAQHSMEQCDISGCFNTCISISAGIYSLKCSQCSFAGYWTSGIETTAAGRTLLLNSNEFIGGIITSVGNCINIGPTWLGPTMVNGNEMRGDFWGTAQYGVVMQGGSALIVGNNIANFTHGVFVAAALTNIVISNNNITGSVTTAVTISVGAGDYYNITDNIVGGSAVTDGGTGIHKTVAANN